MAIRRVSAALQDAFRRNAPGAVARDIFRRFSPVRILRNLINRFQLPDPVDQAQAISAGRQIRQSVNELGNIPRAAVLPPERIFVNQFLDPTALQGGRYVYEFEVPWVSKDGSESGSFIFRETSTGGLSQADLDALARQMVQDIVDSNPEKFPSGVDTGEIALGFAEVISQQRSY